jgi:DNA-binding transcriptional regulator/RsmH inhibitor MraZ
VDQVEPQPPETSTVEPPLGMFNGKLDDKGRLKLPVPFQEFLSSLPERRLFVTSTDRRTAQIYPIANWRENQKLLREEKVNKKAANTVLFNAQDLGADGEMEGQGRVTFNSELRKALDMDGQTLRLYWKDGHLLILTETIYEAQKRAAAQEALESKEAMEGVGLQ